MKINLVPLILNIDQCNKSEKKQSMTIQRWKNYFSISYTCVSKNPKTSPRGL